MFGYLSSIRFRMMALAIASLLIISLLVYLDASRILQATALDNIQLSVAQTSETLNIAIAPYTTAEGLEVLSVYFEEMVSGAGKGLVYLALSDDQGRFLLSTQTTPQPLPAPSTDMEAALEQGIVHVRQRILLFGDQVGHLNYGLSSSLLRDAVIRLREENALLVVIVVSAFFLTFSYFLLRFNRRFQRLLNTSNQLARGSYGQRADETGNDEIADLSRALNHMAGAVQDRIHALEESRREVESFNVRLEKTVVERTQELKSTLENLQRAQKSLVQSEKLASLGSVVAAVAHELNTPIGNARTVATTLLDKNREFRATAARGLTHSALENYMQESSTAATLVEGNLDRAANLIRSFKHVAVDQTSSQCRDFDLGKTLEDVVSTLRPGFKQTHYLLHTDLPTGLRMNSYPGPIGQILSNLVNNAIIHGFAGRERGQMQVAIHSVAPDQVEMRFDDDGNGMTERVRDKIFDPFFTTSMGKGGSGLGMNIVHNLVTGLLGGEIHVDSRPGEGTQIRILLPVTAPVTATAEAV